MLQNHYLKRNEVQPKTEVCGERDIAELKLQSILENMDTQLGALSKLAEYSYDVNSYNQDCTSHGYQFEVIFPCRIKAFRWFEEQLRPWLPVWVSWNLTMKDFWDYLKISFHFYLFRRRPKFRRDLFPWRRKARLTYVVEVDSSAYGPGFMEYLLSKRLSTCTWHRNRLNEKLEKNLSFGYGAAGSRCLLWLQSNGTLQVLKHDAQNTSV